MAASNLNPLFIKNKTESEDVGIPASPFSPDTGDKTSHLQQYLSIKSTLDFTSPVVLRNQSTINFLAKPKWPVKKLP